MRPDMLDGLRRARATDGYARWERRTDSALLALALVFLVVLLLPLAVRLTPWQNTGLSIASALIWAVFAVDYAARLYLAPARWPFVRSHPLDLLVVLLPMLRRSGPFGCSGRCGLRACSAWRTDRRTGRCTRESARTSLP
jgi:hypothetical protein